MVTSYGLELPDYPWDRLTDFRRRAAEHSDGVCDLSIGTPVDPTPEVIRRALADASDAHGYPTTAGTAELREAIAWWYENWHSVQLDPATEILPTVGSKELVAWLPTLLGLRQRGLAVACPSAAYPTYELGATIAGVECRRIDAADIVAGASLEGIGLVWINTPSNPTGEVLDADTLAEVVRRARAAGVILASDECYGLLNWESDGPAPSVLSAAGESHAGVLSVYSMSKQSNLAGYRAAFVAGDGELIADLTRSRKHAGMIVPFPVQAAMIAGLRDTAHVLAQKEVYRQRRELLRCGLVDFGFRIDHSSAGLYLWSTAGKSCWDSLGGEVHAKVFGVKKYEVSADASDRFNRTSPGSVTESGPSCTPQAPKGGWSIKITRTLKDISSGRTTQDGFTTVYRPVNKVECKD